MYDLNDTIAAVSSTNSQERVIIRITGPETVEKINQIFRPPVLIERGTRVITGKAAIDEDLEIDALLYLFLSPNSYTGDDVAEFHIYTNAAVTEALIRNLLGRGLRLAGPGEFTARAYLAGKIDLSQAEAVNEIVVSSNTFQLAAAEKLLSGRLAETTAKIQTEMMDCLSLIEAGLDFSGEDIEFITKDEAVDKLAGIKTELERLLAGSIRNETLVDLPAVSIAGAPNAGKSSLLNKLLGEERSIVSDRHKTTRDVLTGLLTLAHCRCVLFDCAGLTPHQLSVNRGSLLDSRRGTHSYASIGAGQQDILDELAQQAAIEALRNASVVIFCVDISKSSWLEDIAIRRLIEPKVLIPVATKSDLLSEDLLAIRLAELNKIFGSEFLPTSVVTSAGIEALQSAIDTKLLEMTLGKIANRKSEIENPSVSGVALTARHKHAVTEAIENISEAISELKANNDEVTVMMLRAAYKTVSDIEQQPIDEQILERIFSRFCIGK